MYKKILFWCLSIVLIIITGCSEDSLYSDFKNPPTKAKPFVRWWWNGNCVTETEIVRELDVMQAAGIGGIEINPIAMPEEASKTGHAIPDVGQSGMEPNDQGGGRRC